MRLFFLLLILCMSFPARSITIHDLDSLNACISQRQKFIQLKEQRIEKYKKFIAEHGNAERKLEVYERLYREYYAFQLDSTNKYLRQEYDLAIAVKSKYYEQLSGIHKAELLSMSGFYSEARDLMDSIISQQLDPRLAYEYHYVKYWLYIYWSNFAESTNYQQQYNKVKNAELDKVLGLAPEGSALRSYFMGEHASVDGRNADAVRHYNRVLQLASPQERVYPASAYALAREHLATGDTARYERCLIDAAIADQLCLLKESYALQELATYISGKGGRFAKLATQYIYLSMDDARYYGNRLRMLEISQRMPIIVQTYQNQIQRQHTMLTILVASLGILALLLVCAVVWGNNKRRKLRMNQLLLQESNAELASTNDRLHELVRLREKYVTLFIDICASYMERINKYKTLVTRKIKAGQAGELLQKISSERVKEEETNDFLSRFDKAFLLLYPDFVERYNALLRDDCRTNKNNGDKALTPELRIAAMIRLGITDTQEIATLLSYTSRTIYNYRSVAKNKAICKESFEQDVANL